MRKAGEAPQQFQSARLQAPSVLGEGKRQGCLQGGLLVNAVVLETRRTGPS